MYHPKKCKKPRKLEEAELLRHVTGLATLGILVCVAIFSPSGISLPDELLLKIMLSLALGFFVLTAARGVGDQNCFVMLMREDDAAKIYSYFQLPWIQSSLTLKFFTVGLALVVTVVILQMVNLLV